MASADFYTTLGIARNATDKDIKSAFRRLARKYHPDVNPGDKSAESRFKEINEAYEVLSDPAQRSKYDRYGKQWKQADAYDAAGRGRTTQTSWTPPRSTNRRTTTFDWDTVFADEKPGKTQPPPADPTGGANGGFGDIFDRMFRNGGNGGAGEAYRRTKTRSQSRGEDIEHPAEISLEEAFSSVSRTIQITTEEACTDCNGTGRKDSKPCATCFANGVVKKPKRLEVKIPAGVTTGSRVRIAGEGATGANGGPKGDLFLVINVKPNDRFERKGDDIYTEFEVPLVDAVLGGEVPVTTLRGRVALKVPAETQNGRQFLLRGQGMPKLGTTQRGDLYAKARILIPTDLTARQKLLFEELRANRVS